MCRTWTSETARCRARPSASIVGAAGRWGRLSAYGNSVWPASPPSLLSTLSTCACRADFVSHTHAYAALRLDMHPHALPP